MNDIEKISIKVHRLHIPVFQDCSRDVALSVLDKILAKQKNQDIILKSYAIIVSTTGLSNAIVDELEKKYGDALPLIYPIPFPSAFKTIVNENSKSLLSNCEDAFSEHTKQFDMAMDAFARKAKRQIARIYSDMPSDVHKPIAVVMDSFLLTAVNKVLENLESQPNDGESTKDQSDSDGPNMV